MPSRSRGLFYLSLAAECHHRISLTWSWLWHYYGTKTSSRIIIIFHSHHSIVRVSYHILVPTSSFICEVHYLARSTSLGLRRVRNFRLVARNKMDISPCCQLFRVKSDTDIFSRFQDTEKKPRFLQVGLWSAPAVKINPYYIRIVQQVYAIIMRITFLRRFFFMTLFVIQQTPQFHELV